MHRSFPDLTRISVVCLAVLVFLSVFSLAATAQQIDLEKIRADIDKNGWSFEVDDTFVNSLTAEEYANLRGYSPPPGYQRELESKLKIFPITRDLPGYLNWAELGGVTSVKSQGSCGSCWAFAATAELESYIKIYYGLEMDLSEQQVVSCNPYNADCDGGWATAAYFIFDHVGAVQEHCHPYLEADLPEAPCLEDNFLKFGFIDDYHYVSNNVQQIKAALQTGPVCTGIDASDEFEGYYGGCYDVPGTGTNHLVLIVGYDDNACDGQGAWIIKNSWGSDFGVGGYITVAYGAGSTGSSVTQLEYTPPPVSVTFDGPIVPEVLTAGQPVEINWTTAGSSTSTMNLWLGAGSNCFEILAEENIPNTGSYIWNVTNHSADYATLMLTPSGGTLDGFGFSLNTFSIRGHKVRYVSSAGSNVAPYDTPETAAHNIDAAVSACTGTDSVFVAQGQYFDEVAINSSISLFGGFDATFSTRDIEAYPTIWQGANTAIRIDPEAGDFPVIDGFTFRNCYGEYFSEPVVGRHGAAIYTLNASPTIRNCTFSGNEADPGGSSGHGGAICLVGGSPIVQDCTFSENMGDFGGALAVCSGSNLTLRDCEFQNNGVSTSATVIGAGLYVEASTATVSDTRFIGNGGQGHGGALAGVAGTLSLDRVDILDNAASVAGAGINTTDGQLTLTHCLVRGNQAQTNGGGLNASGTQVQLSNTRFTANTAGAMGAGLYLESVGGFIENCLLDGNTANFVGGAAVFTDRPLQLRNNSLVNNTGHGIYATGDDLAADYNTVWNNTPDNYLGTIPGQHDVNEDPRYVDALNGDFGLGQFSPCIDAGADDPTYLDPDGSRADIGWLGGPTADFVAPAYVKDAALADLGGGQVRLTWSANTEPDIVHYVVYRDTAEIFSPRPDKALGSVTHPDTEWDDTPPGACYYLIVAVDADGHCGGYSQQVNYSSGGTPVGDHMPVVLAIAGIAPNPFNPLTTVRYDVPQAGPIRLAIFDVRGRLIRDLVTGPVTAGRHEAVWNGRNGRGQMMAAGVYFVRMTDGHGSTTAKMVLAK